VEQHPSGLWAPPADRVSMFRKDSPPVTGKEIGIWQAEGLQFATLPGGGVLQFDLSRLTLNDYRMMRDHYQINANLTLLTFMIHQIEWRIQCADKRIANEIESQLRPMWTQIIRAFSQSFWAGFSGMALQYDNDVSGRRIVLDKVKDLVPETTRVNWKEVPGYSTPGRPKTKYRIYDGIQQEGVSHPIPTENTLWYPLLMENGDYYGKKLLRPAFVPWFFSMLIHLYANRYFERFGEPLPIGRADYDASYEIGGQSVSGREAMENILVALRSRSVVTLPSDRDENGNYDFDLEYLESQMRGADFERYLTRLDEEISLGLFTPILMLRTVDVGSYNLGVNHMQVWMWMLNAIAADMKQYLDDFLIQRLKAFNFSPNAPRAEWVPRPLGKQDSETSRTIVSALLKDGMVKMKDLEELGQAIGMSLEEVQGVTHPAHQPDPEPTPPRDDRVGRPERESNGGVRIENSRATANQISERVRGQITKAFREGTFGSDGFMPSLGFRRQFEDVVGPEAADKVYARLTDWLEDFVPLGPDGFSSPNEFMASFDRALEIILREMK
jgi:hypothetical protein